MKLTNVAKLEAASALTKAAALQQWLALKGVRHAQNMDNPWSTAGGHLLGSSIPYVSLMGAPEMAASLLNTAGEDEDTRAREMEESSFKHRNRSYGEAAGHGAQAALPAALAFGLLGGLGGGAYANQEHPGDHKAMALAALLGAGALGGTSLGLGAGKGIITKWLLGQASKEDIARGSRAKSRNRVLSALPGGDIALSRRLTKDDPKA